MAKIFPVYHSGILVSMDVVVSKIAPGFSANLGDKMKRLTQIGDPCSEGGCNGKIRCVETEIIEDRAYMKEKIELECSVCKKRVTRYEWK